MPLLDTRDLVAMARAAVLDGGALSVVAREKMAAVIGVKPSRTASDRSIGRNFLAALGLRINTEKS